MRSTITKDGSLQTSLGQKGVNHFQDSYLLRKTYFGAELPALVGNYHTFAAGQPSAVDSNLFGFGYEKELIFLNGIWLAK